MQVLDFTDLILDLRSKCQDFLRNISLICFNLRDREN